MSIPELFSWTFQNVIAEVFNPAVPSDLLVEMWELASDGICQKDIIDRLRPRTVLAGYSFHTWKEGTYTSCTYKPK